MSDTEQTTDAPQAAAAPKQPNMVDVTYRADDGDPVTTTWRGRVFIKDKPLQLDENIPEDAALIEAARGNRSFDVADESKAEQREQAARKRDIEHAQVELARLENEGAAMDARQEVEVAALEAGHQRERDAFLNTNEQTMIALRATIRGSDGSDNLHPIDPPEPETVDGQKTGIDGHRNEAIEPQDGSTFASGTSGGSAGATDSAGASGSAGGSGSAEGGGTASGNGQAQAV